VSSSPGASTEGPGKIERQESPTSDQDFCTQGDPVSLQRPSVQADRILMIRISLLGHDGCIKLLPMDKHRRSCGNGHGQGQTDD